MIASIPDIGIFGISRWRKSSEGSIHDRSVICAILSPVLFSGTNGLVFRIHNIFRTTLKILRTPPSAHDQRIFGSFGGGGKFGSVTPGREGISGRDGNVGGAGIIFGTAGRERLREPSPMLRSGQRIFGGRGSING